MKPLRRPSGPDAFASALGWALLVSCVVLALPRPLPYALFVLPLLLALGGPGAAAGIGLLLLLLTPWARSGKHHAALGLVSVLLGSGLGAADAALGLWVLQRGHIRSFVEYLPFAIAGAAGGVAAGFRLALSFRKWRPM